MASAILAMPVARGVSVLSNMPESFTASSTPISLIARTALPPSFSFSLSPRLPRLDKAALAALPSDSPSTRVIRSPTSKYARTIFGVFPCIPSTRLLTLSLAANRNPSTSDCFQTGTPARNPTAKCCETFLAIDRTVAATVPVRASAAAEPRAPGIALIPARIWFTKPSPAAYPAASISRRRRVTPAFAPVWKM